MDKANELLEAVRRLHTWGFVDARTLALERLLASDTRGQGQRLTRELDSAYRRAARLP
jgi:hypothetical protein